jgi:hypothetical protein
MTLLTTSLLSLSLTHTHASILANNKRDQINVTPQGLGEAYESKIKQFFDE